MFLVFQEKVLSGSFLFGVFDTVQLVDTGPEVVRVTTERDAKEFQEFVHTGKQSLWRISNGVNRGRTFKHDNAVSQVGSHDEIVLHNKTRLFGMQNKSGGTATRK